MKNKKNSILIFRASPEIMKEVERLIEKGFYNTKTQILDQAIREFLGLDHRRVKKK